MRKVLAFPKLCGCYEMLFVICYLQSDKYVVAISQLTPQDMNFTWYSANINIRKLYRFLLYRSLKTEEMALSELYQ